MWSGAPCAADLLEGRRRARKGRPLRDGHRDVQLVRAVGARVIAALDAAVASGHWAPFHDAHTKAASTRGGQQIGTRSK